ncbi:MAG: 1,4-alpha-glucan branching protein GlgB [Verrucomicrobiales bacterium]
MSKLPTFRPGEIDAAVTGAGQHRRLYEVLGAHGKRVGDKEGFSFAVWAPNARRVSVVGDWNGWDGRVHAMQKDWATGVWHLFVPGVAAQSHYKFEIEDAHSALRLKSDPFAFFSQHSSQTASITWDIGRYRWNDEAWQAQKRAANPWREPMSIYEVHLSSWARQAEDGRPLSYLELADALIDYVADLGFTHIELLPITEHPFDGSWGYQVTGYFASTSRHGTPDEFKEFIDRAHQRGLGVILDWVPAHFPKDDHGLARFDGTALYEHKDPRQGEHSDWGTLIFNYGRDEVRNFLLASAQFWLREYHIDGLRVDAVASMIYLDYSRAPGQWLPNYLGGRENLEAISFLRELNRACHNEEPGVLMIAEESTAWPGVSRPIDHGGLGFGFKWNMGWMHDTLDYFAREPIHRKFHHGEATFSLLYAFNENFILPLSHDEVVHGKRSLLGKMPGDRWQQFANLRLLLAWMWTHPGKKLLFMGGEFGQWREWSENRALDWDVLLGAEHSGLQRFVRQLNRLYREEPALHLLDHEGSGFAWIDADRAEESVFVFRRHAPDARELIIAINATSVVRRGWQIGVQESSHWREILNSDEEIYGGSGVVNAGVLPAQLRPWHSHSASIQVTLPPLAAIVLVHEQAADG